MLHELKSIDADKVNPLNPAMHIPNASIASIIFAVFLLDFQCIDSHMKYNAANIAPINNRMFPILLTPFRCWLLLLNSHDLPTIHAVRTNPIKYAFDYQNPNQRQLNQYQSVAMPLLLQFVLCSDMDE